MNTIIPERLAQLDTITLNEGQHRNFDEGHCAMEVVSWLAGEGFTDAPACASPVLRVFTISLNDQWNAEQRQRLVPLLPRMVGTADDGLDETRSYLTLDGLIRTYTPAWLDLAGLTVEAQQLRDLSPIVDMVAAPAAGPVVRAARNRAAAAGAAAEAAAGAAAWAAAGAAAGDAAGEAAWAAAGDAARAAAEAAAGAAARDAARAAAWAALRPTVESLQVSALDLLDRMIDPEPSSRSGCAEGR